MLRLPLQKSYTCCSEQWRSVRGHILIRHRIML